MINIVVPMAGHGSRFRQAGYQEPKPLIEIDGIPMIRHVIENLTPEQSHRFVFLCLEEHIETYALAEKLSAWSPGAVVIPVHGVTEGAAATVMLAEDLIADETPLMIANSDQWVDVDVNAYLAQLRSDDGLIMTMASDDPKWSYVTLSADGLVTSVVEKVVVSRSATVGIYNFRSGRDFTIGARRMIADEERSNGEFYVAPVYNRLIARGARVRTWDIGAAMFGLGTPQDLQEFVEGEGLSRLRTYQSRRRA